MQDNSRYHILFTSLGLSFFFVLLPRGLPLAHCKLALNLKRIKKFYLARNRIHDSVLHIYTEESKCPVIKQCFRFGK
jgi:hypothetical protein